MRNYMAGSVFSNIKRNPFAGNREWVNLYGICRFVIGRITWRKICIAQASVNVSRNVNSTVWIKLDRTVLSAFAKDYLVALPTAGRTIVLAACRIIVVCVTAVCTVIPDRHHFVISRITSWHCIDSDIFVCGVACVVRTINNCFWQCFRLNCCMLTIGIRPEVVGLLIEFVFSAINNSTNLIILISFRNRWICQSYFLINDIMFVRIKFS